LNERKDAGLPRVTRYDFLRMDLVPSKVEGTEARWEVAVIFFWMHFGPLQKRSQILAVAEMGGSRNYKNKNKKSQSQSESMMGKKNHFFFVFPVLGPTLADEDTNRGLHAGALLPFSYKRGEGAFQVKQ